MTKLVSVVTASILLSTSVSHADGLTVAQCMGIEVALTALNSAGAQMNDPRPPAPGAKQYILKDARWAIAMNLSILSAVSTSFSKSRNALILEIGEGKNVENGTPEMNRLTNELQKILDKPCDVTPARIKLSDLNLGDGPDQNAIPPSVLAALVPIIDK